MARSIRWPPEIVDGRLVWTQDPAEATRQIVRLSLSAGTSSHPFVARRGVTPWSAQAAGGEAEARRRIADTFRKLEAERRARLVSLSFERRGGEFLALVSYEDLETGRRDALEGRIDG